MVVWILVQDGYYIGAFRNRASGVEFLKGKHPYDVLEDFGKTLRFGDTKYILFPDQTP